MNNDYYYNYSTTPSNTDGCYDNYYTCDPNNNYHINIPYNTDNTEEEYADYFYGKYEYDWRDDVINRLKKIIEELVNIPPIKIPIWIYENYDLLKELGIEVREKKEDNKKEDADETKRNNTNFS